MKLRSCRPLVLLVMAVVLSASSAAAQKFLPDDPVRATPTTCRREARRGRAVDGLRRHRAHVPAGRARQGPVPPAQNVNTLGEVPDSSWFDEPHRRRGRCRSRSSCAARTAATARTSGHWTVIRGKSGGITPGFTMRDARGDVYFVKFDPPRVPRASPRAPTSSAAAFFHAFGYFVPETYIAYARRTSSGSASDAKVRVRRTKPRQMEQARPRPDPARRRRASPTAASASWPAGACPASPSGPTSTTARAPTTPTTSSPTSTGASCAGCASSAPGSTTTTRAA